MLDASFMAGLPPLLAGKRIVVLGSASGLGRVVALAAQAAGAEVLGIDDSKGFEGVDVLYHADLTDPNALNAAIAAISGPVDGVALLPDLHAAGPQDTLARMLLAPRHLALSLAPKLGAGSAIVARSAPPHSSWHDSLPEIRAAIALQWDDLDGFANRWGHVVEPTRGLRIAGWGMLGWVMANRWRWAERGVRVNTVTPAAHDGRLPPEIAAAQGQQASAGIEQAARATLFLLSGLSNGLTGANLAADGGLSARIQTSLDGI